MTSKEMMKNGACVVLLIILVILLSKVRTMEFMITTYLGRIIMIALLIFMTCINKFLGIIFVLMIIVLYKMNSNKYIFVENFENDNTKEIETPKINVITKHAKVDTDMMKKHADKKSDHKKTNIAQEGFDLQSTEDTIRRGKQSNSIPVEKRFDDSENVMPTENIFSGGFAFF